MSGAWIAAIVALWIVVGLIALVLLGVLRRTAYVLERVESQLTDAAGATVGAPIGAGIAEHELHEENGELVYFTDLLGAPALYLFMSVSCEPCHTLAPQLEEIRHTPDAIPLRIVMQGESDDSEALELPSWAQVLFDANGESARAFRYPATPQVFALDERGIVIDSLVPGSAESFNRLHARLKGGDRTANDGAAAVLTRG
ncbi:MAG: hypothetical protein MSC30_18820 [Gaiellaceae bacterium MAG52_C11]|nr:hypothetical protein [Candidatus Gaiellasilicea maunaloa]